ncbi:MAG TPA: phosphodiester glycosidase family protein [Candidatus Limiplasma sp.]|nr:phosphodiester glycosidase family protein [Candidatus Limiplasma sp.]HRX09832.1 phosphodiester glycosidase family protein [Candidatus Limiplasma sp.]
MKSAKRVMFLILLLTMVGIAGGVLAAQAKNVATECSFDASYTTRNTNQMIDGQYTTFFQTNGVKQPYVTVTSPAGIDAYGVYICFAVQPDNWLLQTMVKGEWYTVAEMTNEFMHVYIPLYGTKTFRIIAVENGKKQEISINEIFVFTQGDIPDWVQRWEPTPTDADLMFLVAHPDDELIFLGGAIPTYAVEQQRKVVVVYMTYSNTTRRSELLNGLWAMGMRQYPVMGEFWDKYSKSMDTVADAWGLKKANTFAVEAVRRYKPKVIVTHDFDGEYGHGAHMVTAKVAERAYQYAGDAEYYTDSAEEYGVWQPLKLYAHLYPENQILMDWSKPLQNMGGKTGLELAMEAYALHITQAGAGVSVEETGTEYDNRVFGLVYSEVGKDVRKNDFLENVLEPVTYVPAPPLTQPQAVASPVEELPAVFPELNESGFLDEGEFIYDNDDSGQWVYISPTVKIIIERKYDGSAPLRWYEAEIWSDIDAGELLNSLQYDDKTVGTTHVDASITARKRGTVFGINTDYYTYRQGSPRAEGIVIRDGTVVINDPFSEPTTYFPNLDTLALFPDGSMQVHASYELPAQAYLDMGATDVYSFGPWLINNGVMNPASEKWNTAKNPRCAIGMVEPGHYVVIMAEGRIKESDGVTMLHLALLMEQKGCQVAFNLDGGQTAVILFMGRQLNTIGAYDGQTSARRTTEILGIGTSASVPPEKE